MTQGDTARATLIIKNKINNETYTPSESEKILFYLKRNKRQTDCNYQTEINNNEFIINSNESKNFYAGEYTYYIKLFLINGDINTIASGALIVLNGCDVDNSCCSYNGVYELYSDYKCEIQNNNMLIGTLNYDIVDSGGNSILQFKTFGNFPNNGKPNVLYIDQSENTSYRWDQENLKYYIVGTDYNNIKYIQGGTSYYGK